MKKLWKLLTSTLITGLTISTMAPIFAEENTNTESTQTQTGESGESSITNDTPINDSNNNTGQNTTDSDSNVGGEITWEEFSSKYNASYVRSILLEQTPITQEQLNKLSDDQIMAALKTRFDSGMMIGDAGTLYSTLKANYPDVFAEQKDESSESESEESSEEDEEEKDAQEIKIEKLKDQSIALEFAHSRYNITDIRIIKPGEKENEDGKKALVVFEYEFMNLNQDKEGHPNDDWIKNITLSQKKKELKEVNQAENKEVPTMNIKAGKSYEDSISYVLENEKDPIIIKVENLIDSKDKAKVFKVTMKELLDRTEKAKLEEVHN